MATAPLPTSNAMQYLGNFAAWNPPSLTGNNVVGIGQYANATQVYTVTGNVSFYYTYQPEATVAQPNVIGNDSFQFVYGANVTPTIINTGVPVYYIPYYQPETTEERIAREEREMKERVRMEAAASRAEQLLFACITEEQKKEYLEKGYFETKVKDKFYRIKKGFAGNVFQLDETGKEKYRYCIHPTLYVPDQDNMLAQFLLLHSDERKFLATANRTVIHP